MKNSYRCCFVISISFFLLILAGCGTTQPSRFYTLHSIANHDAKTQSTRAVYNISVALGPVHIPDYLDRPQIVSRTGQNELTLSEFDRWAGSLKDDIVRVLSEDLTVLLSQNSVFVLPWGRSNVSDYRITVDIMRFDAMPEGNVLLNAQWTIIGTEGKQIPCMRESLITEPISEQTHSAKVSAMSRALGKLSREIAEGITAVSPKNK